MNICIYTNKECEKADKDGECRQGQQNCGWEDLQKIDGYYKELQDLYNNYYGSQIKLLEKVKGRVKLKHILRYSEYEEGYSDALYNDGYNDALRDIEDLIDNVIKELGNNG